MRRLISALSLAITLVSCVLSGEYHPSTDTQPAALFVTDIANEETDQVNETDSEPSIAVNPLDPEQVVVLAFSGEWGTLASGVPIMAPVWRSNDGGKSWIKRDQIPPPPPYKSGSANLPPSPLRGPADQELILDSSGRLNVVALGVTAQHHQQVFLYRQEKGPEDPLTPGQGFGDGAADQPKIANAVTEAGCQSLLTVWLQAKTEGSMLTYSSNAGKTVTTVDLDSGKSSFRNRTARIAIDRRGDAYIVRKTKVNRLSGDDAVVHFNVQRSHDCGKTWAIPVSVHGSRPVRTLRTEDFCALSASEGTRVHARAISSDAWIATGPNGEVYVSYVSVDDSQHAQIYMAVSPNRGETWVDRRVTDGLNESGFPEIAVSSNGTVGVLFVDCAVRNNVRTFRHRFAQSIDRGVNWRITLLQEMDPLKIPALVDTWYENNNEYLWGDYEGLTAMGNKFYGVFTGRSIGRRIPQLDPIFFKVAAE